MGSNRADAETRCAAVRERCSLRLDGELSQLERKLLSRHLARCGGCREYDAALRATIELVRSAPLETPSRSLAPPLPARRSPGRRARLVAALSAAALVMGVLVGSLRQPAPAPQPSPEVSLLPSDAADVRRLPRRAHEDAPPTTRPEPRPLPPNRPI
ncbi:MAG: zf-HC2 domain-containing protein [Actinobacteria bacterium]|nr:zf-HC2 domain-containing protein [Actinomycetota bacterium]